MKSFQAKHIQKIVNIPKHRYEYIASKIGITPEIEEVEKTGQGHRYSFKNLLQFAIVHRANSQGITPKAVKEMLDFLSNNIELQQIGLFYPEKTIKASLHYADVEGGRIFKLTGPDVENKKGFFLGEGFDKVRKMLKEMEKKSDKIHIPRLTEEIKNLMDVSSKDLDDIDGYITINLGVIKDRVLEKLEG